MSDDVHNGPQVKEARRENPRRASSIVGYIRHPVLKRFGIAVRTRRGQLGLTQAALAARTSFSRSSISAIEHGRENISLERAERLAQALECRLADLLE